MPEWNNNGYTNEFHDYERIKKVFCRHMDTIKMEKTELAERLEGYLNFQVSTIEESLQLTDANKSKELTNLTFRRQSDVKKRDKAS